MDLRFTAHARWRLEVRQISLADVYDAIANPNVITEDDTAIRYDKILERGILRVVVSQAVPDPPLVVTVMWLIADEDEENADPLRP